MIEQNVQVLRCDGESLSVRMGSQPGCTACDNGKGCGAGLFASLIRHKPVVLELARNGLDVEAGQMLTIAFPEQVYMKMVLVCYGWPLMAALLGAFGGHSMGSWLGFTPVLIDAFTLVGGVLAAWIILRFFRSRTIGEAVLNSLDISICLSSKTPNMCTGAIKNPEHHAG